MTRSDTRARVVRADDAHCPACGHDEARVRTRGNAYAATCTSCSHVELVPMLYGDALSVFDEPSSQLADVIALGTRARSGAVAAPAPELPAGLGVTFRAPRVP